MQTRQNVFDLAGGDTTQLVKTKEALESKGIDVDLSRLESVGFHMPDWEEELGEYIKTL